MSDAQFPARTAGDLTLPNGDTVWVCQLNSRLHEESDRCARWQAQKESRSLLKGGTDYPEILAQFKEVGAAGQATFLADQEYWTINREVADRNPLPEKPEQGDTTPEEFTQACVAWEEACKSVEEKRTAAETERYDAEVKKAAALSARARLDKCCAKFFARRFAEAFTRQLEDETMFRAVRHADDHDAHYFASPEAYKRADDAVQVALREFFYVTLADPHPADIPTLPAA